MTGADDEDEEAHPEVEGRTKRGTFAKGVSGNPKGSPSIVKDIKRLARNKSSLAVSTLEDICKTSKDDRARYMAAKELLDRGWGKVKDTRDAPNNNMFLELLKQLNERNKPVTGPVVDITPIPAERPALRNGSAWDQAGAVAEGGSSSHLGE